MGQSGLVGQGRNIRQCNSKAGRFHFSRSNIQWCDQSWSAQSQCFHDLRGWVAHGLSMQSERRKLHTLQAVSTMVVGAFMQPCRSFATLGKFPVEPELLLLVMWQLDEASPASSVSFKKVFCIPKAKRAVCGNTFGLLTQACVHCLPRISAIVVLRCLRRSYIHISCFHKVKCSTANFRPEVK
jgi:hypothetical protein